MDFRARRFTSMCLTFLVPLVCLNGLSLASNALSKPTDLRVTSVHDLTVTLTWNRPPGIPITTNLLYSVRYIAGGSNKRLPLQSAESAQITLRRNTRYNINVKAMQGDDHQVQSDWASLRVNTGDFVPAKPTNIRMIRVKNFVATVAWDEPRTTSTGIPDTSGLSYQFSYKQLIHSAKNLKVNSNRVSVRLVPNSKYEMQVKAYKQFDAKVYGPWSDPLSYTSKKGGQSTTTTKQAPTQTSTTLKQTSTTKITKTSTKSSTLTPTTVKLTSTTKKTTKTSATSSVLAPTTVLTQGPQRISTGTVQTAPADPTASVQPTKELRVTTAEVISEEPTKKRRTATESSVPRSTDTVAFDSRVDKAPQPGLADKLLTIGAPAVGVLLLLIILGAVLVFSRKRSRKRRLQNGEIPLQMVNLQRHERSRDAVTRGVFSVRYEPAGDDSMRQGLLQPNGSLPRGQAEDAPLLGATCPEKCKMPVDLNKSKSELATDRAEGLYESIGSLKGVCREHGEKNDSGEAGDRYVTHDQMGVKPDKAPLEPADQVSQQQWNGAVARATQQGNVYENLRDSEHLYDTPSSERQDGPVYENTRVLRSPPQNRKGEDGEYEPLPI